MATKREFVKQVYDYRGYPKGSRTIMMMMPRPFGAPVKVLHGCRQLVP